MSAIPRTTQRLYLPAIPRSTPAADRPTLPGATLRAVADIVLVVLAVVSYFLIRGLMSTSHAVAVDHAHRLVDIERWLGVAVEADIQRWAESQPYLMPVMNSIYIYAHWPVVAGTLGWLLWRHREAFTVYRTALVLSGLIGMVFFMTIPMAPPRFLPELGFVDTIMRDTESYRVLQPTSFTNQYAAMPSLHVGWNLLMGIAIYRHTSYVGWKIFAVVMPLAMYAATIFTANHFVLDGVVGASITVVALMLANRYRRGGRATIR